MRANPDDRYRISEQPSRVKRAVFVLVAIICALLATLPAWGQNFQGPAEGTPRFRMEPVAALCGSLEDHHRILDANDFEPTWIGSGSVDGAATGSVIYVRENDGFWMVLVMRAEPGKSPTACIVASGTRLEVPPPSRGGL